MSFDHLVKIDTKENRLTIYRVFEDGKKELYTYVEMPSISFKENENKFSDFAKRLGENILLDSPVARERLGL